MELMREAGKQHKRTKRQPPGFFNPETFPNIALRMIKFGLFKDFTVLLRFSVSIDEISAFISKPNLEFYSMTALCGKHF